MSKPNFDKRLSVGMTDGMDKRLEELAISRSRNGRPVSKADLIREAVRLLLDEQPDVRNSRKQIAKSIETQIASLQAQLNVLDEHDAAISEQLEALGEFLVDFADSLKPLISLAASKARKQGG